MVPQGATALVAGIPAVGSARFFIRPQLAARSGHDTVRDIFEKHPNAYQAYGGAGYTQALDYYSGNSTKVESSYRSCLLAAIDAYYWRKNDPTDGAVFHNGYELTGPAYILTIDKNQKGWQNYFYKLAPGYILCSCH